jgi:hypothetical protein
VRPLTFWTLVAATLFVTMTVLWVFGGEPEGAVFVISAVLYWGSGLALIVAGMIAIGRFRRGRDAGGRRARRRDRRGGGETSAEPADGGSPGSA